MAIDFLAPLSARDALHAQRVSDSLIGAAGESVEAYGLTDAVILTAFACALGRLIGESARQSGRSLVAVATTAIAQVRRVAIREYRQQSFAI